MSIRHLIQTFVGHENRTTMRFSALFPTNRTNTTGGSVKVWKYRLKVGVNTIEMPSGSWVIHTHEQDGAPTIWAMVWPKERMTTRTFVVEGTGFTLDDSEKLLYVGTAHCGPFVWHVFEVLA